MKLTSVFPALVVLPAVFALPASVHGSGTIQVRETSVSSGVFSLFDKRKSSCAETCGTVCYTQSTLHQAVSAGYQLYKNGQTKDDYPHTYNNYEGFDFPISGPYQEYPVLSSFKAYSGSSPGADRVIFNTKGVYAATITHTGASGDDFVACD